MRKRLVKANSSGDWIPNSSMRIVFVERILDDADGLYGILGVRPDATDEEIRSAAKRKMLLVHPDVGGDTDEFIEVSNAYKVLSDRESRSRYDRKKKPTGKKVMVRSCGGCISKPDSTRACFFKYQDEILSSEDIGIAYDWMEAVLESARNVGASLEIKVGISKKMEKYEILDDIAVMPLNARISRGMAIAYVLRQLCKEKKYVGY